MGVKVGGNWDDLEKAKHAQNTSYGENENTFKKKWNWKGSKAKLQLKKKRKRKEGEIEGEREIKGRWGEMNKEALPREKERQNKVNNMRNNNEHW